MKYYFLSDAHLGSLTVSDPAAHQAKFIGWLEMAAADGDAIFLLGDIFDFWFEFPKAIPEGYDAVIETIRRTVQRGVEVHFFCGNHDQWTFCAERRFSCTTATASARYPMPHVGSTHCSRTA